MSKLSMEELRPAVLPVSAILTSAGGVEGRPDDINLGWTTVLCYSPPLIGVSLKPERYAYELIKETGEFVVNVPTTGILEPFDRLDMAATEVRDKFEMVGLTPLEAEEVGAPLIAEAPVNVECRVTQTVDLGGSHELFVGRVVAVHVDQEVINDAGELIIEAIQPFVMCPGSGEFWDLGKKIGHVGFTASKKNLY